MGASTLWLRRREILPRLALAAAVLATVAWAFVILGWSPTWNPALRWVILVVGVLAALGIALTPRARGVLAAGIAGFGIASIIAAPAAYSLNTAATPHSGAIPSAGPAIQGGSGRDSAGRADSAGREGSAGRPTAASPCPGASRCPTAPGCPTGSPSPEARSDAAGPEASVVGRRPVASAVASAAVLRPANPAPSVVSVAAVSEEVPGVGVPAACSTDRHRADS